MTGQAIVLGGVFALAVGCGSARFGSSDTGAPSLTLPAHFAEGSDRADAGGRAKKPAGETHRPRAAEPLPALPGGEAGGTASDGRSAASSGSAPPDPLALSSASQWELALHYAHGDVRVDAVRARHLDRPLTTARRMGRFAVELWIGRELVERLRFDFPLLGGEPPPAGKRHPLHESTRFAPGADTRQTVLVPASDRATAARIVDRATGREWPLIWPPEAAGAGDGGVPPN